MKKAFIQFTLIAAIAWADEGTKPSRLRVAKIASENGDAKFILDTAMSMPGVEKPTNHRPTPTLATAVPVAAPVEDAPTAAGTPSHPSPTMLPAISTPTGVPSISPTLLSFTPSIEPSQMPTNSPTASFEPSRIDSSETASVFTCTGNGVTFATPPFQAERIDITVGYEVESSLSVEDIRVDLEKLILGSILTGALECGTLDVEGNAPTNTSVTDSLCVPEVDLLNDCAVLQTSTTVLLASENFDPQIARFLAYVKLERDMETFHEVLDGVDRVTYISPTIFRPPGISAPVDPDEPASLQSNDTRLAATPWTVGAALAMCVGGVVAIWAWMRNRRTRNQRLLEESSLISPNPIQA